MAHLPSIDSQRLEPYEDNSIAKPQLARTDSRQDTKSAKKRFIFLGAPFDLAQDMLRAFARESFRFQGGWNG
jgi:hypothetical protein